MKIAMIGAVCVLLAAGCSAPSRPSTARSPASSTSASASGGFQVSGSLVLTGANSISQSGAPGEQCSGIGGYSTLTYGAQVIITGKSGQTVGLGELGAGVVGAANAGTALRTCQFTFSAYQVPFGEGFYGVEIAGHSGPQFPEDEISTTSIELTLGT